MENRVHGQAREIIRYRPGVLSFDVDTETGERRYRNVNRTIAARDVIHLLPPLGRAPLTLAREAIGIAVALDNHAAQLFTRGARPSGALKFPKGMGEEAVKKAREAWRRTHVRLRRDGTRRVRPLNAGPVWCPPAEGAALMLRVQAQLCQAMKSILSGKRVPVPEAGRDVMAMFFQLSEARTWHANGPNPIGFVDIEAWCRLMRVPLPPHHVALIRALDAVWVEEFHRKRAMNADHKVKTLPPMSAQPLTAALFDVTAG